MTKKTISKMVEIPKKELLKLQAKVRAEERKKAKKAERKIDGLGSHLKSKIRSAMREVWHRSEARKIVVKRVDAKDGFSYCEHKDCKLKRKKYPKTYIDHIENVGDVDSGFIERMFVSSDKLQALCKYHHDLKTKQERASKNKTKKTKSNTDDFF